MGGWCKIWFNSRSLNSFFNWTIFFPLYAELQIFLKFVKKQWGLRGGHNFPNVNDRKKLSVVNVYIVFSDNAHIYTCIYNTCALSKHIGNMCMRLRNGGKGEVFPRFVPNTHIYLYASTVHMYCIYLAILNRK